MDIFRNAVLLGIFFVVTLCCILLLRIDSRLDFIHSILRNTLYDIETNVLLIEGNIDKIQEDVRETKLTILSADQDVWNLYNARKRSKKR
ncbi:MAG: hypothetical protein LBH29_04335 [Elusimicrobiota bacterium]|jgi:hypothetical protein|nr:hypothetical protein [Elusimicrobiota bacterium]